MDGPPKPKTSMAYTCPYRYLVSPPIGKYHRCKELSCTTTKCPLVLATTNGRLGNNWLIATQSLADRIYIMLLALVATSDLTLDLTRSEKSRRTNKTVEASRTMARRSYAPGNPLTLLATLSTPSYYTRKRT